MEPPKFKYPTTSFRTDLRKRINDYFSEIQSKPTGNYKLYFKAVFLLLSYTGIYIHLVFFTSSYTVLNISECILLGGLCAGIGFNVMHDGAHGSFSQHKWINNLAGLSLNFLGANVFMWKTKHNVIHHTYTNIAEVDDDLNARPFLRLCEAQKPYKIHRFQHMYFWLVYSFLYFWWVFVTDYRKYFTQKIGVIPVRNMEISDHLLFWGFKALHLVLFVIIPIQYVGFSVWLIGFLTYAFSAGFVLSLVFQLAHSVQGTDFPTPNTDTGNIEEVWIVHQLKTTANFATKNKIVSWFTGGLNYQIEHHLFPGISHVHYPALRRIVKQACQEYNLPYLEFPNVRLAIASHIAHLKHVGNL